MQLVEAVPPGQDSGRNAAQPETAKPVVLVMEHVTADAEAMTARLAASGIYPITTPYASRGIELVRALRPNLVLVNQGLPDLSGFRVVQQLARAPSAAGVPVLLVGRAADPGTRVWAQRAGAVGYLSKEEADSVTLTEMVGRHMRPVEPTDEGSRVLDPEQLAELREIATDIWRDPFLTESGKVAVIAAEAGAVIGLRHCRGVVLDEHARIIVDDHEWLMAAGGAVIDPSIARLKERIGCWPGYRDIAVILPSMPLHVQYIRHS